MVNHYATLGVPPVATAEELHVAYKTLALRHHPDRGGDGKLFATITAAYGVLKDPARRRDYDAQLKLLGHACHACSGAGVRYVQRSFARRTRVTCVACKGTGQKL